MVWAVFFVLSLKASRLTVEWSWRRAYVWFWMSHLIQFHVACVFLGNRNLVSLFHSVILVLSPSFVIIFFLCFFPLFSSSKQHKYLSVQYLLFCRYTYTYDESILFWCFSPSIERQCNVRRTVYIYFWALNLLNDSNNNNTKHQKHQQQNVSSEKKTWHVAFLTYLALLLSTRHTVMYLFTVHRVHGGSI